MSSKFSTDLQFPFLNFRRRHNILKTKLHGEFVQKDWNSFPTGFIENSPASNDQKTDYASDKGKQHLSKNDLEVIRRQLLQDGYRTKKRKSPLQLENGKARILRQEEKIGTFTDKKFNQKSEESQVDKNKLIDVSVKHTNSVFLEVQNIQNSFQKDRPSMRFKSPSQLSFAFADGFEPRQKGGEEIENVPKRSRMCHSTFVVPSEDAFVSAKAVQRVNASVLSHSVPSVPDSFCFTEPAATGSAPTLKKMESRNKVVSVKTPNSECVPNEELETLSFRSCLKSAHQNDNMPKKIMAENISALIEARGSGSKGSNWVHSLPPAVVADTDDEDSAKKRKIRNILPGGFAEQMLKLQRREKSEMVIWKHKTDQSKRKGLTNSLSLVIANISLMNEIMVVKCVSDPRSNVSRNLEGQAIASTLNFHRPHLLEGQVNEDNHLNMSEVSGSNYVIVLFKKGAFTKLHLNVKDAFVLYQPWQTLQVKSIPYPVILCAYFVECVARPHFMAEIEKSLENKNLIEESGFPKASPNPVRISQRMCSKGDLFWRGSVTLSARVQRVWQVEVSSENFSILEGATRHSVYSLLLQTEEGSFYKLIMQFCSESVPNVWLKFLSGAEGRCYLFRNLHPSHRLHFKRHKDFFRILSSFSQFQKGQAGLKQRFCYQLMLGSQSEIPQEIGEEFFPVFRPIVIQPLSQLLNSVATVERVSCLGKLLLKYNGGLYISDGSLCRLESLGYIQVQSLVSSLWEGLQTGTVIIIKEALLQEGYLLLDSYSKLRQYSVSSEECRSLGLSDRVKQLSLIQLQNVIPPLSLSSQVTQLVSIKGNVKSVNENKACTWLQCSFCLQENLIQDTNLVIYCEDCSQVVPKPVLNVKMEVTINCPTVPSAVVNVQLLSVTIRRILEIDDNTYQPQCIVADVLGKTIGPLFCYVRNCEIIRDQHLFHLSEVQSS